SPPTSTLFPYTTLFRSQSDIVGEQNAQHEARCQQPIEPAGIIAEIEPRGVEQRGLREIEQPGAEHDHHPEIEDGVGPSLSEQQRSEEHTSELQSQSNLV